MKKLIAIFYFLLLSSVIWAQQRNITGVVYDESGMELPGVNVVVQGTTIGTITDIEGKFSITVNEEQNSLVFSFIGYKPQTVDISSTANVTVNMEPDAIGLSEVVAVGYGVQKKVNLTGAVAVVDGDAMAKQPVTLASEALQGASPGVTVTKNSGAPGSGATLRIRGVTSFNNSDPLILIDGIEGGLNSVDPNDIESISVLKDAASASIYGSRGANGVVLITTKRAKSDKFQINYKGWIGVDDYTELPNFVGALDYMRSYNQAVYNDNPDNYTPVYSDEYLAEYEANMSTDPDNYPNTNWQDLALDGSGVKHSHYIGVSGGTDKIKARATFSHLNQKGLIKNNDYKSYTLRSNNDFELKKWISLGIDINGRYSEKNTPSAGLDDIFNQANRIPPIYAAQFTNGNYGPGWSQTQNPLAYVEASGNTKDKWYSLKGKLRATIKPIKGMEATFIYAPSYISNDNNSFRRQYDLYNTPDDPSPVSQPAQSSFEQKHETRWQNNYNALLSYTRSFGDHNLSGLIGYEAIDYDMEKFNAKRLDYPFPDYQVLNSGSEDGQTNGGTASQWSLKSQFARINYNFKEKYLFEANARRDGSSRFQNERWEIFPSFSAGWRMSEESFLQKYDWLDNLKVRASWGRLGNQNVKGNYPFMAPVNITDQGYVFGTSPSVNVGGAVTTLPNPDLTWEYTETTNIGLDAMLWNGLLSVSAEYYIRKTSDIIDKEDVAEIVGLGAPFVNAFEMENKGFDLSIRSRKTYGDFSYDIGLNFDDVRNKITDLYNTDERISGNTISRVGHAINSYYLYDTEGLLQEGETHDVVYKGKTAGPGDIKYIDQITVDTDGDGIPDATDGELKADDKVIAGSSMPRYNYSFDINLKYKIFDLSLFFQGVGKRDRLFTGRQAYVFDNSSGNIQEWQMDYWTSENPNASFPKIYSTNRNNFTSSTYWLRNGAYLRLKNIQFGINVPSKLLKKYDIESLRFFVTGQNLITWDHMPEGWDPETIGATNYPIVKTLSMGLDVKF